MRRLPQIHHPWHTFLNTICRILRIQKLPLQLHCSFINQQHSCKHHIFDHDAASKRVMFNTVHDKVQVLQRWPSQPVTCQQKDRKKIIHHEYKLNISNDTVHRWQPERLQPSLRWLPMAAYHQSTEFGNKKKDENKNTAIQKSNQMDKTPMKSSPKTF